MSSKVKPIHADCEGQYLLDGQKIRTLRTNLNISQEKLANKAGITRNRMNIIEQSEANVTTDTLFRLCTTLGVKPQDVVVFVESEA
jgi:DNA-binding Xre family transcriptional regulator